MDGRAGNPTWSTLLLLLFILAAATGEESSLTKRFMDPSTDRLSGQSSCRALDNCSGRGTCLDTSIYLFPYASPKCHVHWVKYKSFCFRIMWKNITWKDARESCAEAGGDLFNLSKSKSTYDFNIKNLLNDMFNATYLKNATYDKRPNLWTGFCENETSCFVILAKTNYSTSNPESKSNSAFPLCVVNLQNKETVDNSQCFCKHAKEGGVQCEGNDENAYPDANLCEHNLTCPLPRHIQIDFAAFGELKDRKGGCSSKTSQTQTDCFVYNSLFLLRYWCQGKQSCGTSLLDFSFEPLLKSDEDCFQNLSNKVMTVRQSCAKTDDLNCSNGDIRQTENGMKTISCVKPIYGSFNWWTALETCRSMGGNLAFLRNDSDSVYNLLKQIQPFKFLHESETRMWIRGTAKYLEEPDPEHQTCAYLQVDLVDRTLTPKLLDTGRLECDVTVKYYWLCKLELPLGEGCPYNATPIKVNSNAITCYLLGQNKLTWGEARAKCQNINGTLAPFYDDFHKNNSEFYKFLSENLIARCQDYWIAGIADELRPLKGNFTPCSRVNSSISFPILENLDSCNFHEERNALCAYPASKNPSTYSFPTTLPPITTSNSFPTDTIPTSTTDSSTLRKSCKDKDVTDRRTGKKMKWPETEGGEYAYSKCPGNARGEAKWYCDPVTGIFSPIEGPDLSSCSTLKENLLDLLGQGKSPNEVAQVLLDDLDQAIYGGDLSYVCDVLDKLLQKQEREYGDNNFERNRELAMDFTRTMTDVFDKLLHGNQSYAWMDIDESNRNNVSSLFLKVVDQIGFSLARNIDKSVTFEKPTIVFHISNYPETYYGDHEFKFPSENDNRVTSIYLPKSAAKQAAVLGRVKTVFVKYTNMSIILPKSSYQDNLNISRRHNSEVMSANLQKTIHFEDDKQVKIVFKHQIKMLANTNTVCVFWNMTSKNPFWDTEGCKVESSNEDQTVCLCNHLTNFAILMDVNGVLKDNEHAVILEWITIVGCAISIVCLSLSCLIFWTMRSLWGLRNTIHWNLCLCLLISQILLLGGLNQTESKVVCGFVAGLMHFFWLAAFVWMAAEGVMIYILLIKVFETGSSKSWHYYAFGYGIPAFIVLISVSCRWEGYGTSRYCWLSLEDGLIFAFISPLVIIVLFNIVILVLAFRAAASVKLERLESKVQSAKLWIKRTSSLVPLLGITWIFGFFFINSYTIVFAYLFAIFSSLQGLFIFVFHCLRNEKVQQAIKRYITRKRERLNSLTLSGKTSRSNSCTTGSRKHSATTSTSLTSMTNPSEKSNGVKNGIFPRSRVAPGGWTYKYDVNNSPVSNHPDAGNAKQPKLDIQTPLNEETTEFSGTYRLRSDSVVSV